jgi:hypothetical protein
VDPDSRLHRDDRLLVWAARKAAGKALEPDESLLGIEAGSLRRFRDNGIDKPVPAARRRARAIPAARAAVIVTYTRRQVLFLGDGVAVNCALVCIHRAEETGGGQQVFAFAHGNSDLGLVEFDPGSHQAAKQRNFLGQLICDRDQERAALPAPSRDLLERVDAIVQEQSIADLWARPPAPIITPPADLARLTGPGAAAGAADGIDQPTWNRLQLAVTAAHRHDAAAYAATMKWAPPGFGLPGQHRTGIYVFYLLGYQVRQVLQTDKPTPQQLHQLAEDTYPSLQAILHLAPQAHLEETLRTVVEMPPLAARLRPGQTVVLAAAALGLLLGQPEHDLAAIRPHLASWWTRNHDSFPQQGLKE